MQHNRQIGNTFDNNSLFLMQIGHAFLRRDINILAPASNTHRLKSMESVYYNKIKSSSTASTVHSFDVYCKAGGILKAPLSLPLTLPLSHVFNGTLMEWKIGILKAQLAVH